MDQFKQFLAITKLRTSTMKINVYYAEIIQPPKMRFVGSISI